MKTIQTILFFLLLTLNLPLYSQCSGHPDYAPLMAFYNATNGPNWIVNDGWEEGAAGTDCNPCNNWYGVFCENNRVTLLFPTDNNISGNIPSEISGLTELIGMILPRNNLTGNIPVSLGSLAKLKILALDANNLTDTIPYSLGNLVKLENFDLSENNLTGPIPSSLGNLNALLLCDLSYNNLSGCIPEELQNLCSLNLPNYILSGNNDLSTENWANFCNNQEGMCGTSAVSSEYQASIIPFPNPTNDLLKLRNSSGKKIKYTKFINNFSQTYSATIERENYIDIKHLPAGVFFLYVLFEDDSLEIVRIIKI